MRNANATLESGARLLDGRLKRNDFVSSQQQLLQERDKPFLDRLFEGNVLGLKSLADCEQPRPPAQDGGTTLFRGPSHYRSGFLRVRGVRDTFAKLQG
jgi:hypothetical protein